MSNNGSDQSLSVARFLTMPPDELKSMMSQLPPELVAKLRSAFDAPKLDVQTQQTVVSGEPVIEPISPFASSPAQEIKAPPTSFAFEPPPNFVRIPHDFLLFDPERCDGRALLGVPYNVISLPKQTSVGKAIVFCAIEPTPCVLADGRIVECKPGEDVLLEVSHWLRRLTRGAMDQENVGEVWARPIGRRRSQDGDFIMEWDLRSGRTWPRNDFKSLLFKKP